MAATGLLGFNPYNKGMVVDFSTKPVNLAIQLEQKESAKRDALDKYFMDYEKSINPAGLRKQEGDVFMQRLNENKSFYLKNRDAILNPAKYGYDAQSKYMANFKDMSNLIERSKQAAANDKITQTHFMAQKDLNAPDGYAQAVEASHLPVTDPNYKPLDVTKFRFYKSHDPFEYQKELKGLNTIPGTPELIKQGNYQYSRTPMEANIDNVKSIAYDRINDEGYLKKLEHLNNDEIKVLENVYKAKFNKDLPKNDVKEMSLAYTLSKLPKDYQQTQLVETPEYHSALINSRKTAKEDKPDIGVTLQNYVDNIFNEAEGTPKNQLNIEGQKIGGRVVSLPEDVSVKYDRKIGSSKFSPDYFFMSADKKYVYPVFVTGKDAKGRDIIGKSGGKTGTKISDRISVDKLKIDLSKAVLGQRATLDYMTGGSGASGGASFVYPGKTKF